MKKGLVSSYVYRVTFYLANYLLVLLICLSGKVFAQPEMQKPARILFLVDASSSMLGEWSPQENRFAAAARIINSIVDSIHKINTDVAFGVRVFGNQFPAQDKNCFDTKLEVPFKLANDEQIKARLKHIYPLGSSPIALSLKEAAEKDFVLSNQYAYSIILVTDGGESCGGDICATVTNLLEKKISFKPYILSMIDYEPLKKEYDCLGKYMTVAKEKDIAPAITTILNDNRKILTIKSNSVSKVSVNTNISAQPVKPVNLPPVVTQKKPEPQNVDTIVTVLKVAPKPEQKAVNRIFYLTHTRRLNLLYTLLEPEPIKVPKLNPLKLAIEGDEPPAATPTNNVAKSTASPERKRLIVEPTVSFNEPKTLPTQKSRKEKTIEDNLEVEQKKEVSSESKLQLYFTDGNGKFYNTEPKMNIINAQTGKLVKESFRNVTAGIPDPIQLPPGTYNINIPGSKSKANNIVIEAGKTTKAYIKVSRGSLAFYHATNPDVPIKKYRALVSKRFERGAVVKQNLDEELPYEPANYHIEVNTLPPMAFNIDLDFNNVKLINIPEIGRLTITNTNNKGKIQLWYQLGDAYVPFHEMMVTGNVTDQNLELLPGLYQLRYFNGPVNALSKAEIIYFRITSRKQTSVFID